MFLRLNGFKAVNDRLGHAAGDRLLAELGQRLDRSLRSTNAVARIGGGEFVPLMEDASRNGALALANRICELMDTGTTADGQPAHIKVSIGVSFFPRDGDTVDRLLSTADWAMYEAKRSGRPVVVIP